MTAQAKTTRLTPSVPRAYIVPVVRELPSQASPGVRSQLW